MNLYSVKNCRFFYGNGGDGKKAGRPGPFVRPAVDIESAEFEGKRIHVLLGPNGSGKTTLLKIFNDLLTPENGSVLFEGKPVGLNPDLRRKTVYVHQNPFLLSGSVFDNIAYGLKVRGMGRKEIARRVEETLRLVGLGGFGRRKHDALSGGELQRVAIARALILKPEVLLLDEPTASVDKESLRRIEEILIRVRDEFGCTVIISTHNFPFAYRICDNLIHMEEGKIIEPYENILKGTCGGEDSSCRIFNIRGVEIYCPHIDGIFTTAVVNYDDIILSKESVESSARNNLAAVIDKLTFSANTAGQLDVKMKIESPEPGAGPLYLSSRVTEQSAWELNLQPKERVYLAFKASSVRLY